VYENGKERVQARYSSLEKKKVNLSAIKMIKSEGEAVSE